jgi:hypothetical protein
MRHGTRCILFNKIALLDHVPQSNRLDHVLPTKQSPWLWMGSVATLEDAKKKRCWAVACCGCFDAKVSGIDSTTHSLASWNYRHGDEAERGLAGP